MQLSSAAAASGLIVAAEDLVSQLDRSAAALAQVAARLESEFEDRFADIGVDPVAVIRRIRRLERDLPELKEQCQAVISTKQELVDSARQLLRGNRDQLNALAARSGAPQRDDAALADAFESSLGEWDAQMRRAKEAGASAGGLAYTTQALNLALARSNLQ